MTRSDRGEPKVPGSDVAFLVGAGRSGTTLLYKLLCLHPEVAYISNYESSLRWFPDGIASRCAADRLDVKLNAWFGEGGNAYLISRPLLKKLFPTPQEGQPVYESCGLPLVPKQGYQPDSSTTERLRRRFGRIRRRANAAIFLSKRTANNRRITHLSTIFPAARYIHLLRDGREVTRSLSTVEWWDEHTLWWDGRTPLAMERSGEARLAVCARNWVREVQALSAQLQPIDKERVLELRFEELMRDPEHHLGTLLRFLGVRDSAAYQAAIGSLNLRPVRARWQCDWNTEQLECVLKETQPLLRAFGYTN